MAELLWREKEQIGYLDVKSIHMRRILRIWPPYFAFVMFPFGLTFIDRTEHFGTSRLAMDGLARASLEAKTTHCTKPAPQVSRRSSEFTVNSASHRRERSLARGSGLVRAPVPNV